ncbi:MULTISPECIES: helix-turn-helix domain-containing protein [Nocardiopsis]|uniref:helix-turn-helix domain-containing protein n=1 Tax=Nocardiopsis TaxID=2013 RepID=UPI000346785B|nr:MULTISPECIES: helix-turn-helix transcriptional regulator [Nocardiopsis]PWV51273.1 helix-turn-helix protein [Nocardiopsis sp. L17-MgMaSL7]
MPKDRSPGGSPDALDRAMSERRLALGLGWGELAARAGLSEQALRDIRSGRSAPRELTVHRLESALGWTHGSVRAALSGDEPTVADSEGPDFVETGADDGLSWSLEGEAVCYELTRMIDGNPFTARLVVRDGRPREQVERELGKIMRMARIQLGG